MKFNKKASMQLSINMIVILIIAVVILGLALGFVKGMFGKMNKTLMGEVKNEPEPSPATPGNPITMSRTGQIIVNSGEQFALKWGVFCAKSAKCTNVSINKSDITCNPNIIADLISTSRNIPKSKADTITTTITISDGLAEGISLCTLSLLDAQKDFVVEVMK